MFNVRIYLLYPENNFKSTFFIKEKNLKYCLLSINNSKGINNYEHFIV